METKYICIHGHFYQPPRENAWLEAVEVQDSAHPYHDWNRRITVECYSANVYSRILDDAGRIEKIVNNYEKISFNFGPTLLAWMEIHAPDVYQAVLEADKRSLARYSGHGSALAQAYNHMIMPLAHERDKHTQVLWAIRDFERRFGRRPEGMWLPETAVDLETLEVLADQGILFTILSPDQAAQTRGLEDTDWCDVSDGAIDPKVPYLQRLEGGGTMTLFFYDGPISRAVAFEGLLKNGEAFAERLVSGFADQETPQLLHIATDGESYGHHFPHGDMALAYALHYIESQDLARLTNYGEFLEKCPPTQEVRIKENTSWSCVHGIARWHSDCGCSSGAHPGWHQQWRGPLREALDWLRDELAQGYEDAAGEYVEDPWKARDHYISVILDRSVESIEGFMTQHCHKARSPADNVRMLKLLEIQRQAMLMYTSCGWFFDEISGIETVQIMQYAGRAIQLYQDVFGSDLESEFLERLAHARSNIPEHGNGRRVYEKLVKPAMVDLKRVGAHYAISSLFEDYGEKSSIFCCGVSQKEYHHRVAGSAKVAAGRVEIISGITQESENFRFGVFHMGDHQLACGLSRDLQERDFGDWVRQLLETFDHADFTRIMQLMDDAFSGSLYSLKSLFRDGQRKILHAILEKKIDDALTVYRYVYEPNVPLIRFLQDSDTPIPPPLYASGQFVINQELQKELARRDMDHERITSLLREAELAGITLDTGTLEYTLRKNLEQKAEAFHQAPENQALLEEVAEGVDLVYALPFDVNLRRLQNIYYELKDRVYPGVQEKMDAGDQGPAPWVTLFEKLCKQLNLQWS